MMLPSASFSDPFVSIYHGDSWALAPMLKTQSINCIVTSPPYWGLRDYGEPGQFGLESTPEEYVARLVDLFQILRPALRDDGTLWLNLGDSYASGKGTCYNPGGGATSLDGHARLKEEGAYKLDRGNKSSLAASGLKPKDLVGIPWRVAFALQADGWYLRQDIIWHKPNPMPESVTDRCTKAHEYMFLLSKRPRYYYDAEAVKEQTDNIQGARPFGGAGNGKQNRDRNDYMYQGDSGTRNRRSVWTVATQPFSAAHFATFPPELIRPCILAGCPERTCPRCGAAWERIVEKTKTFQSGSGRSGNEIVGKQDLSASDTNSTPDIRKGPCVESRTVGFAPICTCGCADTIPGTVLDPFMGSGTTAAVARKLGRRAVGFELNAEYIQIAAEHRLSEGMLL